MKKFLIFFFILFIHLNVNAETLPYNYQSAITVNFWGTTAINHTIIFSGTPSKSSSYLQLTNYQGLTLKNYNYFIVTGCRHGNDISVEVGIRSSSGRISNALAYNSLEDCNDGYAGKITYIQYQVTQWEDLDGTWEELYADANSTIYGTSYFYVIDKFFSTEDMYSQLIQGQLNYNAIKEQISQSITNTNTIVNSQTAINDSINDDGLPSTTGWLDSWTNLLLENNQVNQILYLPVNILNKVSFQSKNNCTPIVIPFGLTGGNETLSFNCWQITDYLGNTVGDLITGIVGFYLLYYFALFLWKFYDDFTSLKDTLSLILANEDSLVVKGDNNG